MFEKPDLEKMKQQLEAWGISPTHVLMSRDTWDLISNPITEMYKLILKHGYKIIKQEQAGDNKGIMFYLEPMDKDTLNGHEACWITILYGENYE